MLRKKAYHTFYFSDNVKVISSIPSSSMVLALGKRAIMVEGFVQSGAAQTHAVILKSKHFVSKFLGNQCTLLNRIFSYFVVASVQKRVLSLEALCID